MKVREKAQIEKVGSELPQSAGTAAAEGVGGGSGRG